MSSEPTLENYSLALDEIFRLRRALAHEAAILVVHTEYATFPKSRRKIAENQISRMALSARGGAEAAYAGMNQESLRSSLIEAGASQTLTRAQWEAEQKPALPATAHANHVGSGMDIENGYTSDARTVLQANPGKFRVVGVDTFSNEDWIYAEYDTLPEAVECADAHGAQMLKTHVYNDKGRHLHGAGSF